MKQLLDEAEYDGKNYADLGGCYPPQPPASLNNSHLSLHNSSCLTQPNNSRWVLIKRKPKENSPNHFNVTV